MCLNVCPFQSHIWSAYVLRSLPHVGQYGVLSVYVLGTQRSHFFCSHFSFADCFCLFLSLQLFVLFVWNFELYMIPLALLLPLAWNYILIASGKDTRQDVVSNLIASLISL